MPWWSPFDYSFITMVSTDEISLATKSRGSEDRRVVLLVVTIPIVISILGGLIGWLLVQPGRSVLVPSAEVAVLVTLPFVIGMAILSFSDNRQLHRLFLGLFAVLGPMAIAWTFFGVLPASVVWNSSGPQLAATAATGPNGGCRLVTSGSVGLVDAPYNVCVNTFNGETGVTFAEANSKSGYVYLTATSSSGWFPDECSRHLIGNWWAFGSFDGTASCPFGYQGHGGG
jgi:hypothetical protein